ncbi:MAG: HU family DNA-binding protein [Muribaculaceae bacterium]|nr:HU family DNA-binding protein [Muribaculaceae bacterium]
MNDSEKILANLSKIIADALKNGDSVALPGFGTFNTAKSDEYVGEIDGESYLFPPRIDVIFTPALKLSKQLKEKE